MKAIPKFLTFMALLGVINFANASSLIEAYTVYRKASNTDKDSSATASALKSLENICKTSCGGENCKDKKVADDCTIYCGYVPECSKTQGLKPKQHEERLASLGITSSDEEDIPNAPLPQEPITTSNSVSDKQANGNSPTEVIIRVVVDNPSAASCKLTGDKIEGPQKSDSVHQSARPLTASSPQQQEVAHSQSPAVVTTEDPAVIEQPVAPQPAKPVCTPQMKMRRLC